MTLDSTVLAALIQSKMAAEFGPPVDSDLSEKAAKTIAEAIVEHITAAAVVTVAAGIPVVVGGNPGTTTGTGTGAIS